LKQTRIACYAGESNDGDVRELDEVVSRRGSRCRRNRRGVPNHERQQRAERAENGRRNDKAHQNGGERLAEREVQAQQRREHGVEQRIAASGKQDDEREFDGREKRLLRVAPPAHRRAVKSRAQNDDGDVQHEPLRAPTFAPRGDCFRFTAQERGEFAPRNIDSSGFHAGSVWKSCFPHKQSLANHSSGLRARKVRSASHGDVMRRAMTGPAWL